MVKRILLLSLFLVATTLALRAQNVVTGTVVDRDGNPIPGAKVEKGLSVRGCQVESAGPEIQAWLEEAGLLKEENRA